MKENALNAVFEETSNYFSISTRETVRITQVDHVALRTWSETWKSINTRTPPNGGWDWTYKRNHFNKYSSKRLFDMAIWGGNNILCGLALGKMSKGLDNLSIYYIEGFPSNHPLKGYILDVIIYTIIEYARLMGRNKVKLIDPVDGLIDTYKQYGFTYIKGGLLSEHYCEKQVV